MSESVCVRRRRISTGALTDTQGFLGDHGEGETPVPIPNTAVKPFSADGTAWVTVWESRTLPRLKIAFAKAKAKKARPLWRAFFYPDRINFSMRRNAGSSRTKEGGVRITEGEVTRRMIGGLSLVDQRSYQAGLLGADREGLHKSPAEPRTKT